MKDCFDYMENMDGMRDLPEDSAFQAPPRPRTRRRDVDLARGTSLADIHRTMGLSQSSQATGETLQERLLREMTSSPPGQD